MSNELDDNEDIKTFYIDNPEERIKAEDRIKPSDQAKAMETLHKHLTDRKVASTAEFAEKGTKQAGVSAGYVGKRKEDEHTFMLKSASKTQARHLTKQQSDDRRDFINEYILAPLYRRWLFDRAPIFELTTVPDKSSGVIYGRSKFFDSFKVLGEFAGSGNGNINRNHPNLKKLEGFEKVIAACLFAGEYDYHSGNLGVVSKVGDDGKMHHTVVKIDHGRSGGSFFTNASKLLEIMIEDFNSFGYNNIPFDLNKFKVAIDEMVKISDEEIENMISSRFDLLVKNGFEFKDAFMIMGNDNPFSRIGVGLSEPAMQAELKKQYIARLKRQRVVLKELSTRLDVIASIDFKTPPVNALLEVGDQDPIQFAIDKKLTIGGLHPVQYAINHGMHLTDEQHALLNLQQEKLDVIANIDFKTPPTNVLLEVGDQNPISFAIKNKLTIGGLHPVQYAINHGMRLTDQQRALLNLPQERLDVIAKIDFKTPPTNVLLEVGDEDPIIYAMGNRLTIGGLHPVQYALDHNIKFDGRTVLSYAFLNKVPNIKGVDAKTYALQNNSDALKQVIDQGISTENIKDIIKHAIDNNRMIGNETVIGYAIRSGNRIERMRPIEYLLQNDLPIAVSQESLVLLMQEYIYTLGLKESYSQKLEEKFRDTQEQLAKINGTKILGSDSQLGQLLNSAPSFIIASKLGLPQDNLSPGEPAKDLLASCSFDVLLRINKVTRHIDTKFDEVPFTYYLHVFADLVSNIVSKGVTDAKIIGAAKEIASIAPKRIDQENSTFTDRIKEASEKLGPTVRS